MSKRLILIVAILCVGLTAMAQSGIGGVKAKIVSRIGRVPVANAEVLVTDSGEQVSKAYSSQNGDD